MITRELNKTLARVQLINDIIMALEDSRDEDDARLRLVHFFRARDTPTNDDGPSPSA